MLSTALENDSDQNRRNFPAELFCKRTEVDTHNVLAMQGRLTEVLQAAQDIADEARALQKKSDVWNKIHIRDFAFSKSYLDNRQTLPSIGITEESNHPDYDAEDAYTVPAQGHVTDISLSDAPAYTGNEALQMKTIIDREKRSFTRVDVSQHPA